MKNKIIFKRLKSRTHVVSCGGACFVRGGGDFNCHTKDIGNFQRIPIHAGHTNDRNYLGFVVYSALQKRYFLLDFPFIADSLSEEWKRLLGI
jgi:hypothetical protein